MSIRFVILIHTSLEKRETYNSAGSVDLSVAVDCDRGRSWRVRCALFSKTKTAAKHKTAVCWSRKVSVSEGRYDPGPGASK